MPDRDKPNTWNWKIIPLTEGKYEITDGEEGKVHARMVGKEEYLKLVPTNAGNATVVLTVRDVSGGTGHARGEGVHRIVWETFKGKLMPGIKIVMTNGIQNDPRLSNLAARF